MIKDLIFTTILESKQKSLSSRLTSIVKELKSSDFGMSRDGGNGLALAKNGQLILRESYYYFDKKRYENWHKGWVEPNGEYAKWFGEKYNVKFTLSKKSDRRMEKLYGGKNDTPGYIEMILNVEEQK